MKRVICVIMSCMIFVTGCGSNKNNDVADMSFLDGAVKFENNAYTLGKIFEYCNDALMKYYDVSDNCNVYEANIYIEKDGTLLTTYESEFEVVLVDENTQKQYDITAEDNMKTIYIQQTDKSENASEFQLTPWDTMLSILDVIDYNKIAESKDDYISVDITGIMDISEEGMQISTEEATEIYTIQSKKMLETATNQINGKYYGVTFTGCSNSGGGNVYRTSGMIYNHVVGVLEEK